MGEKMVLQQNLILENQVFIICATWEYSDDEYYLKEDKGKFTMSMEDQHLVMPQITESFAARIK